MFYFQASGQYNFIVDDSVGCAPHKVRFSFISTATTDSVSTYYWSFGNGVTSSEMEPDTVVFETGGLYDPTLVLKFVNGAERRIGKPDLITVHTTIQAGFDYNATQESFDSYHFEQNSVPDTSLTYDYLWEVEEVGSLTGPTQEITFPGPDIFSVSLTITDESGCSSTVTKLVTVLEEIEIPNVFTPGDDVNNFFLIKSPDDVPLRIRIFSRTGILVYESEGPVITWNGETASGDKLKSGIYFYFLEAISGDPQKLYTKTGFLHMYRK
jgi:gliding motility-associated-like protein